MLVINGASLRSLLGGKLFLSSTSRRQCDMKTTPVVVPLRELRSVLAALEELTAILLGEVME